MLTCSNTGNRRRSRGNFRVPAPDAWAILWDRHSGEYREIDGAKIGNVCERKPVARHKRIGGQLLFDPVVVAAHAALAALDRYCAADTDEDGLPGTKDASRCQSAVAVLRANGAFAEADALLEATYRGLLVDRNFDASNFTGLAEVLYRRGRADEAGASEETPCGGAVCR